MTGITLHNSHLTISVLPEAGGKITCLRRTGGGREWLWSNPTQPVTRPVYGASYVETMDSGGWDEIFPSVFADTFGGLVIPDHGDLVGLPWEITECDDKRLVLSVRTRFADCLFQRALTIDGPRLHLSYRLQNCGSSAVPYLWCAHPLIALEPGMEIVLPAGTPMSNRGGVAVDTSDFHWPVMRDGRSLARIPDSEHPDFRPFALKMFTESGSVDRVEVIAPDGRESLQLSWEVRDTPNLGLWLNALAWSGCGSPPYFNLGLEPSTAPFDFLSDAAAAGAARYLEAGRSVDWELTAALGTVSR